MLRFLVAAILARGGLLPVSAASRDGGGMMPRLLGALAVLALGVLPVAASADGTLSAPNIAGFQNSSGATVPVACDKSAQISAAGSVQLITASGTTRILVCGFSFSIAGTTTPTLNFNYGTGSVCATGTVFVTGAYPAGVYNYGGGVGSVFIVPSGNNLCIGLGGTGPAAAGILSYAQLQ